MHRAESDTAVVDERPAPTPGRRRFLPWLGALALVAGVAVVVFDRRSSDAPTLSRADVDSAAKAAVDKGLADARSAPPDSALVYQSIVPSLVVIRAELDGDEGGTNDLGSGVVIDATGRILTARHVIAKARDIKVTFSDGTDAGGRVVAESPENDIAVLAADHSPDVIVPAVIGSTHGLQVGDAAYAVGHPLSLVASLSAGVISGLDRTIPAEDGTTMKGLIQFDAAVNPGSSGGPLLNRDGQVIGIVTSLANPSGQGYFVGIGFAVPIGTAAGAAGGPEQ